MKKMRTIINRFDSIISFFERFILFLSMSTCSVVVITLIFCRWFDYPLTWAYELSKMMLIIMIYFSIGYGIKTKSHISIGIFADIFPKSKKTLFYISHIICIIGCLFIIYFGIKHSLLMYNLKEMPVTLKFPLFIPYLSIPIGALLMLYRLIQTIFQYNTQEEGQ